MASNPQSDNPLLDSGKPLFFPVRDAGGTGVSTPAPRLDEALRVSVRSLSAMQKEAIVASARSGGAWRLASDEGAYLAGLDAAPCPLAFMTAGMVASTLDGILALAEARGVRIERIRLIQDNYYTMRGSALRGTMRGGAKDVDLTAHIESGADRAVLDALVRDAVAASPVSALLAAPLRSLFTLTHNGSAVAPDGALPLAAEPQSDPEGRFDAAEPAAGDWSGLVRRGGTTPRAGHTVTMRGDSLAPEQDRLLHLRGLCTLTDDGLRAIEQQLFNPHGSIFHFLADRPRGSRNEPPTRAPDALSYVAAGIAFCFMTQFGRYAQIAKKRLERYRIVQDTHFSAGGGTARAAKALPVETHVYLDSGEDDAFARQALDMAEQTCFLHALCAAELRTNVSVQPYRDTVPAPQPPGS